MKTKEVKVQETKVKEVKIQSTEDKHEVEWEITKVQNHKVLPNGTYQFLLKYKGYPEATWTDDAKCDCEDLIQEYFARIDHPVKTIHAVCRVSCKNQTGPMHISLEAQENRLRKTIGKMYAGEPVRVKVYRISASAYKGIPKTLVAISEVVRAGDVIMIYRVDRLSRNIVKYLSFLEDLDERNVGIFAQFEELWYNGDKKLDFIQRIVDANREALAISSRVKLCLELRKERGDESLGSVQYGMRLEREEKTNRLMLAVHPEEQAIIDRIKREYNHYGAEELATQLNREGILKRGRKWSAGMVKSAYKGN